MSKPFYITTTIPYVNADPHIGFAQELVQSDVLARYNRLIGNEVFFSTGTDEYGQKIWEASQAAGEDVIQYVDRYAEKYVELSNVLNVSIDNFIRTTSEDNIQASQEVWRLCDKNGDIYKKKYKGLYCVGCEKFVLERDLVDGRCPLHPHKDLDEVEEENYFFRLSKYKEKILEYLSDPKSVVPEWRRKEALEVAGILEDFSVSRDKKRFSWGIAIPDDDTQVMYVWFGAFVNYISTLGWPREKDKFEKFWVDGRNIQTAGKDMVKFQSIMWQGMLLSAGLKQTETVVYHGFVTGEGGVKMSKSLGNTINPFDIINEYGADALRYFLAREVSSFEDSPFTLERFKEAYNANLANGLGNLVSRIMTLSNKYLEKCPEIPEKSDFTEYFNFYENFEINKAADYVWNEISALDKFIQETEPFKVVKVDENRGKELISDMVVRLYTIARMLNPIMPSTNVLLKSLIKENKVPEKPLFARKE